MAGEKRLPDNVTIKSAFMEHTAPRLNQRADKIKDLSGKKLLFNLTGREAAKYCMNFNPDGATVACTVTEGDPGNANVTFSVDSDDWRKLLNGELNGMTAFMSGKLKVAGDMGLALKLQTLLQ
ncbi:MAG: SCP2 sterol-binding domain-containing protein [Planctomycetes bacterium]|nr:SCP2 sterol-binding domain-containing protein [Planctomycetota bacterium]